MVNKGRLLAFLYIFPPKQGTAAIRNFNQINELSESFEQTFVFTNAKHTVPNDNIKVVSINSIDYRSVLKSDGSGLSEKSKNNWLTQFLIKLINTFPINILLGEGGGYYLIKSYLKAKKLISSAKITHIYSSYRPFVDHYIAYRLKKRYPELIWVADFRDLIIDPHYDQQFFPNIQNNIYAHIFKLANVLTTVSEGLVNKLKQYNPVVLALQNGADENFKIIAPDKTSKFTLNYTGAMFLDERNGAPVFFALKNLIKSNKIDAEYIQINYAGKDGHIWNKYANEFNLNTLFNNLGQISHEAAVELQTTACINILLSISSEELSGVTTGKFIEYLKAGSPVLAIFKDKNDETIDRKLKTLKIGAAFSDQLFDLINIEEFILKEYKYWLIERCNRKPIDVDMFRKEYDRKSIFKPLIELI